MLINDGKGKFPKTLHKALGKNVSEIPSDKIAENTDENNKAESRVKELDDQIAGTFGEERERLIGEREREQGGIDERKGVGNWIERFGGQTRSNSPRYDWVDR